MTGILTAHMTNLLLHVSITRSSGSCSCAREGSPSSQMTQNKILCWRPALSGIRLLKIR
ncbi:hypothetical protein FOWG_18255 [Fusarium oxysporum f. sp. lycopersici MN25]|nr:hypothetical protein FOWG_18255 [Fusarium oxysporum f. sp. lycopersici MN25]